MPFAEQMLEKCKSDELKMRVLDYIVRHRNKYTLEIACEALKDAFETEELAKAVLLPIIASHDLTIFDVAAWTLERDSADFENLDQLIQEFEALEHKQSIQAKSSQSQRVSVGAPASDT